MDLEDKFHYVYAYLRTDGSPYYIGRGRKNRAFAKHIRSNGRNFTPKDRNRIIFLEQELSKQESLDKEREYIAYYGRKEFSGILINIREGGDDCREFTPEMRKRMSELKTGRVLSESHKKNISIGNLGKKVPKEVSEKWWKSRRLNGNGEATEETRRKMSKKRMGRFTDGENPSAKAVRVFLKDGSFVGDWLSARQASRELNLGDSWKHVPECCLGKRKSVKGFIFRYKEDADALENQDHLHPPSL